MRVSAWIKHLRKRRGSKFFTQMIRMWKFHRTSFNDILTNIFDELDTYKSGFSFPIVASVARFQMDNIKYILKNNHEIANHGFKHVKYSFLSDEDQENEFRESTNIFDDLKVPIFGFRAPYNNYNQKTIDLVEKHGFEWDGGIGYRSKFRNLSEMFNLDLGNKKSNFKVVPLNRFTDDLLIDNFALTPDQMSKVFKVLIKQTKLTGGVLMFDLHPIRIGQKKYSPVLGEIVELAHELGAWIPTTYKAVRYWKKYGRWKGDSDFCLLLSGDIDNFVFFDYLRRLV